MSDYENLRRLAEGLNRQRSINEDAARCARALLAALDMVVGDYMIRDDGGVDQLERLAALDKEAGS